MRHFQPSPLEAALDVEALVGFTAVEDALHAVNIGSVTKPAFKEGDKGGTESDCAPYSTPPPSPQNPTPV